MKATLEINLTAEQVKQFDKFFGPFEEPQFFMHWVDDRGIEHRRAVNADELEWLKTMAGVK